MSEANPAPTAGAPENECKEPKVVAALWADLLEGSSISPVEMHPVLWNWSRNKFQPEV